MKCPECLSPLHPDASGERPRCPRCAAWVERGLLHAPILTASYIKFFEMPEEDQARCIPISLTVPRGVPRDIKRRQILALAPDRRLLSDSKAGLISWADYIIKFTLTKLEPLERFPVAALLQRLKKRAGGSPPILLCWCKDPDTCHRSLVGIWFERRGVPTYEYGTSFGGGL